MGDVLKHSKISVHVHRFGADYLFTVTGGIEHIGAVSTVYRVGAEWVKHTLELPGHKEGPLSEQLAVAGAKALQATVTVVAGIHIPCASSEDIRSVVENSVVLFEECLRSVIDESLKP